MFLPHSLLLFLLNRDEQKHGTYLFYIIKKQTRRKACLFQNLSTPLENRAFVHFDKYKNSNLASSFVYTNEVMPLVAMCSMDGVKL